VKKRAFSPWLNIGASDGDSTPPEVENLPPPLIEVGVFEMDNQPSHYTEAIMHAPYSLRRRLKLLSHMRLMMIKKQETRWLSILSI